MHQDTGGSRVGPLKGYYILKYFSKVMSECRKCHIRDTNFKNFPGKHTPTALVAPLKIIPGSASTPRYEIGPINRSV